LNRETAKGVLRTTKRGKRLGQGEIILARVYTEKGEEAGEVLKKKGGGSHIYNKSLKIEALGGKVFRCLMTFVKKSRSTIGGNSSS